MDRLLAAVRPGGRLILLLPNGRSVVGWAAKTFPLRAAILYKKYIEGFRDAGKPGHAPYPTVYDSVVSLEGIREYARSRQLAILEEYGVDYVLSNFGRFAGVMGAAMRAIARGSGNRLTASHNNLGFVLQKPAIDSRRAASRADSASEDAETAVVRTASGPANRSA